MYIVHNRYFHSLIEKKMTININSMNSFSNIPISEIMQKEKQNSILNICFPNVSTVKYILLGSKSTNMLPIISTDVSIFALKKYLFYLPMSIINTKRKQEVIDIPIA